ncbi:MAG TPA: RagB/SusD family nutrient uptake outer membrane protein [Puia sp.]|nr:RagB/SusD family nutrient uptake outer membrane protein [Puia sp.]
MRSIFHKRINYVWLVLVAACSCTKLDVKNYSAVANDDFWQTPDEIAAGVAPAYGALQPLPNRSAYGVWFINSCTSDEMIVPTRGGNWADGGQYESLWEHTFTANNPYINNAWSQLYTGIGQINFILSVLNNLSDKPANLDAIDAELRVLRAYFYYMAMDMYGNVPLVADYTTNPDSVVNSSRQTVYNFVESEVLACLPNLNPAVSNATYGRVTTWFAHALLAKLYLNSQVYTGNPRWADCISQCDSIINSGNYSLQTNYFDNFSPTNESSTENIFVIPYQNGLISGNDIAWENLHGNNAPSFLLQQNPWDGFVSTADFYANFDTTSTYTTSGGNTYRTYVDSRSGQYLIGQQFSSQFTYPPNQNVLVSTSDPSLILTDQTSGLNLVYTPDIPVYSSADPSFLLVGVRNIKYFPEPNIPYDQDNDIVVFRLGDIMLMKAEAELRSGTNTGDALNLVNQIRERAYGNSSHDITSSTLTLDYLLAERARELTWEGWRRQDLIRYEVASGTPYFSAPRTPQKLQDADSHYQIFPIPTIQMTSNPLLTQNPGY